MPFMKENPYLCFKNSFVVLTLDKYFPNLVVNGSLVFLRFVMKIVNSLKTMKSRHKACKVVRRKGRVYVINKENPRFKARQG